MSFRLVPRKEDLFFPLEQTFNKFFEDFFKDKSSLDSTKGVGSYPKINSYQNDNEFVVHVSVPGVNKEDLSIEVTPDNFLVIKGKMSEEYSTPKIEVLNWKHELRQTAFERQFQLPETIENEDPETSLKDGMLTLKWKKKLKEPVVVNKKIPILTK